MLFREIPFLRLFAPLCAGVIAAEVIPQYSCIAFTVAALALAVMTWRLFSKCYFSDIIFGTALVIFMSAAGFLLRAEEQKHIGKMNSDNQVISLRLSGYPEKKNNGYTFIARIISAADGDSIYYPNGSLRLWYMADTLPSLWQPGDRMMIRIRPREIENNGNPCEFNYRRFMEGHGVRYMAFFRHDDIIRYSNDKRRSVTELSVIIAHKMTDAFRRAGLQGEALGLVTALTTGDKQLLDKEQLTSFSRAGAMHVMAVSGLHVGMISMVLSWLLFFLRRKLAIVRSVIIISALWAFAFITGLSASVVRAAIMFTFLQAGSVLHRPATGMNSLLASAFILTAARPSVIFEAGFQLSYIAVAFIILFCNPLFRLAGFKNSIARYLWQLTAVSLVAQAGTLALTVRMFNIFPLLFPVTNLVIIPVTFIVILLAMLLIITSPLLKLSALIGAVLDHIAQLTLSFTGLISSADHGVITSIGLSSAESILLTIAMAMFLTSVLRIRKITLKPFLITIILLLVCNSAKLSTEEHRERDIVYNIRGDEVTAHQQGRLLVVPCSDGNVPAEIKKHAVTRGLKIKVIKPG